MKIQCINKKDLCLILVAAAFSGLLAAFAYQVNTAVMAGFLVFLICDLLIPVLYPLWAFSYIVNEKGISLVRGHRTVYVVPWQEVKTVALIDYPAKVPQQKLYISRLDPEETVSLIKKTIKAEQGNCVELAGCNYRNQGIEYGVRGRRRGADPDGRPLLELSRYSTRENLRQDLYRILAYQRQAAALCGGTEAQAYIDHPDWSTKNSSILHK